MDSFLASFSTLINGPQVQELQRQLRDVSTSLCDKTEQVKDMKELMGMDKSEAGREGRGAGIGMGWQGLRATEVQSAR